MQIGAADPARSDRDPDLVLTERTLGQLRCANGCSRLVEDLRVDSPIVDSKR